MKIVKLRDILTVNNCQFVHNYNTRVSKESKVIKLARKTTTYSLNSINRRAEIDWNELLKHIHLDSRI